MTITCSWCGARFERSSAKGTAPRYCSATCRQRAYEARRVVSATDHIGKAWKTDISRLVDRLPAMAGLQQQVAAAIPRLDLTGILPKFETPKLLTDDTMRALSQAAVTTGIFDRLPAMAGLQQQVAAAIPRLDLTGILPKFETPKLLTDDTMRALSQAAATTGIFDRLPAMAGLQQQVAAAVPRLDFTGILPKFELPKFVSDDWLEQLYAAALRMAASLPADVLDDIDPLLSDVHGASGVDRVGSEKQVLLLLLAALAWIAAVRFEAAEPLVRAVASLIESGVVMLDLIGQAYNALSRNAPDDRLLSWALALTAVLTWIRRREGVS